MTFGIILAGFSWFRLRVHLIKSGVEFCLVFAMFLCGLLLFGWGYTFTWAL
jgi:hypothetical protein